MLLGVTGAFGQVFIFVTIAKFGALTCSIIGLARKIVTLVASIIIYGHPVNPMQGFGLAMAITAMVVNFMDKGKKKAKGVERRELDTEAPREAEELSLLANEDPEEDSEGEGSYHDDGSDGGSGSEEEGAEVGGSEVGTGSRKNLINV